jgi:hypothetical protein
MHDVKVAKRYLDFLKGSFYRRAKEGARLDEKKLKLIKDTKENVFFFGRTRRRMRWTALKDFLSTEQTPFLADMLKNIDNFSASQERIMAVLMENKMKDAIDLYLKIFQKIKAIEVIIKELEKTTSKQLRALDAEEFLEEYNKERALLDKIEKETHPVAIEARDLAAKSHMPLAVKAVNNVLKMGGSFVGLPVIVFISISVISVFTAPSDKPIEMKVPIVKSTGKIKMEKEIIKKLHEIPNLPKIEGSPGLDYIKKRIAATRTAKPGDFQILNEVADEYGLKGMKRKLFFSIRVMENGRDGCEMGVADYDINSPARRFAPERVGKENFDHAKSLRVQAQWAAGTVKKRFPYDEDHPEQLDVAVEAMAKRYCPENWHNWKRMAKKFLESS